MLAYKRGGSAAAEGFHEGELRNEEETRNRNRMGRQVGVFRQGCLFLASKLVRRSVARHQNLRK